MSLEVGDKRETTAEMDRLSSNVTKLLEQHGVLLVSMDQMTSQFNPAISELSEYTGTAVKTRYFLVMFFVMC